MVMLNDTGMGKKRYRFVICKTIC